MQKSYFLNFVLLKKPQFSARAFKNFMSQIFDYSYMPKFLPYCEHYLTSIRYLMIPFHQSERILSFCASIRIGCAGRGIESLLWHVSLGTRGAAL